MALKREGSKLGRLNKSRNVSTSTLSLVTPAFDANYNGPSDLAILHDRGLLSSPVDHIPTSSSVVSVKSTNGPSKLELPKVFGLADCFSIILGSVLPTSILLFTISEVHAKCGGLAPALLVWFCCGAINFVGAQCYAEITAAVGESGGEFILIYRTLNPMPAFVQIWISLLAGTTMVSVTLAMVFSEYSIKLAFSEYGLELPRHLLKLVAVLQLSAVYALHCTSTRWVARVQVILTSLKFVCISIIVAAAIRLLIIDGGVDLLSELQRIESVEVMDVLKAFSLASPIFLGWQRLSFVAGEVQNQERAIPLSMSVCTLITPIVVILLHLSFAVVLSEQELLQTETPVILMFAHRALGPLTPVALLLVSIQALCSMNTGILAGTRTLYAAARESMSPEFWAMLHIHRLTFVPAALTLMAISMPMLLIDNLIQLLRILAALLWFPKLLVALAVVVHRRRFPDVHRPFKVPIAFPFIFIGFSLMQTTIAFIQFPLGLVVCLIGIFPAFPLFIFLVKLRRPLALFKAVEKVTLFLQKLLLVAHDLKER